MTTMLNERLASVFSMKQDHIPPSAAVIGLNTKATFSAKRQEQKKNDDHMQATDIDDTDSQPGIVLISGALSAASRHFD